MSQRLFNHFRNFKYLAQIGQESAVVGHGFARGVGNFGHRLTVALHQFEYDVQRGVAQIVGEVGADAEAGFEAAFEILV